MNVCSLLTRQVPLVSLNLSIRVAHYRHGFILKSLCLKLFANVFLCGSRNNFVIAADSVTESADLKIKYDIHLDHLKQLTRSDLTQWSSSVDPSLKHPLDTLYDQVLKGEHLYG